MDIATILGIVGNTALVIAVMSMTGSVLMYWDLTSIIVVLGGGVLATMVRWPLKTYIKGVSVGMNAIFDSVPDPNSLIDEIIELANTARKESILALEKVQIEDRYLAKAVKCMVDGYDPVLIDSILSVELANLQQRHKDGRAIFENLGEAAPAFGMIGTVMGLIVIMANLSDPDKIGPGLAVALVTTLYGALVANMVFIPLASKLKYRSQAESLNLEIIREGVAGITKGENPRAIRERLESFLAPDIRGKVEE